MIEKQIISQKVKEQQIKEFIYEYLNKSSYSHTEIHRTPLGERIIIYTSRPGMVVGRKGSNIVELTSLLKNKFGLENPQIEVSEITNPNLNAQSVAKRIVSLFERFGTKRFKAIGYRVLEDTLKAGAIGAEVVISGRGVPSSRAKSWRFKAGYLSKSGDVAQNKVSKACTTANLRSGSVGVRISILNSDVKLPDRIIFKPSETKIEVPSVESKPSEKEGATKETKKVEKPKKKAKEVKNNKGEEDGADKEKRA